MHEKLKAAEAKYGYNDAWLKEDWELTLRTQALRHLLKGDPRDLAAYCAFAWHHGWGVQPIAPKVPSGPIPAGVCYRAGPIEPADYAEALEDLANALLQILQKDAMGCGVCGDSGHAAQDGCHHDPLVMARKAAAAEKLYRCFHCGFVAHTDEEGREHFGLSDRDLPVCKSQTA